LPLKILNLLGPMISSKNPRFVKHLSVKDK